MFNPYHRATLLFFGALLLGMTASTANADTIYVCWDGSGDYLTIQEGIDAAADGDELVVCDGTYTGPGNKDLDFGGKAITVRSENGPESCIIDCEHDGRGFHFHSGETAASVTDGLTIRNGYVHADSPGLARGAGIYCSGSSPTITNCLIAGNLADDIPVYSHGGGVYVSSSTPTITGCRFTSNTATYGGGLHCQHSAGLTISDCTFLGNMATWGGAVCCHYSDILVANCIMAGNSAYYCGAGLQCVECRLTVDNCTISGNVAGRHGDPVGGGGGVHVTTDSSEITNCTILANTAPKGGGVFGSGGNTRMSNCIIAENEAENYGGGAFWADGSPTIIACIFAGNAADRGGGIRSAGANPTVINCQMAYNTALDGGGMHLNDSGGSIINCTIAHNSAINGRALACDSDQDPSQVAMANCILWNGASEVWNNDESTITITYSDVYGGWSGDGNIAMDPLFIDFHHGDFHLSNGSPCIDAGDNAALPLDIFTDIEGNARFIDDPATDDTGNGEPPVVDMGAYEFQACPGDLSGDCCVDRTDLYILLAWFGVGSGGDLDCDGDTDHADLGILLAHWGEGCPQGRV